MLARSMNQYEKSLEDFINEAKKNRAERRKVLEPSCPLEFNRPYPGLCTDIDVEEYEGKIRYAVRCRLFNNSFGTEWTERYYPYGGGLMYFNALCDVLGTRKLEDFIGKAFLAVLENDGKYSNLRVRASLTEEDLKVEWDRLSKADQEAGLISPEEYARQKQEVLVEARRERAEKTRKMVEAAAADLDDLEELE